MKNNDHALVCDIAQRGDMKAFRKLFDQYFTRLFEFSLAYVKVSELAEEVVSDVFLKLWNNRDRLLEVQHLESYLYIAVKNQSLAYIEKNLKRFSKDISLENCFNHEFAVEQFTPEAAIELEELYSKLDEAVNRLPHHCKLAFQLVKENGMKYKEAAEVLGVSVKTVENQIMKALRELRPIVEQYMDANQEKKSTGRVIKLASYTVLLLYLFFYK